jgi:hypothetical protein
MNRGITFSFVLVIMVISIFTFGSYQLVHATSTITNTDSQKKLTTDNAKNAPDSQKKLTTDNGRVNPNQDPTILLPFTSNFADTQNGNDIPFP